MESDSLITKCVKRQGVENSSHIKLWAFQTFHLYKSAVLSYSKQIPEVPLWTDILPLMAVGRLRGFIGNARERSFVSEQKK